MTKLTPNEACPKCGHTMPRIKLVARVYGYFAEPEHLVLTCVCGHEWRRLPLDAKDTDA